MEISSNQLFKIIHKKNQIVKLQNIRKEIKNCWSSVYLEHEKILFQTQSDSKQRKAIISAICLQNFERKGIGLTSQPDDVYSIKHVKFQNNHFILSSGNSLFLDIFPVKSFQKDMMISKKYLSF
jgi:hypothetical protein